MNKKYREFPELESLGLDVDKFHKFCDEWFRLIKIRYVEKDYKLSNVLSELAVNMGYDKKIADSFDEKPWGDLLVRFFISLETKSKI